MQKSFIQKKGPSLGNESPKRRIPFPAFFSPGRGVIHPSFPLRGRWERPSQISKQAPSPSLGDSCRSSFGIRLPQYTMQLGDHSQSAIRDPGFPYFCCFSDGLRRSPCCPWTSANPYSGAWNPASGIKTRRRRASRTETPARYRSTRNFLLLQTPNHPAAPPGSCVRSIFVSTSTHSPEGTVVNQQFRLTRSNVEAQTRREVR